MIERVTGASKEEDSGPLQPPCDHTPSQSVTLETGKTDRGERPLSSEYSSPEGHIAIYNVAVFLSVVSYVSSSILLTSVFIGFHLHLSVAA